MQDVVVDFRVDVFRIDKKAVYVEDASSDWWEDGVIGVGLRHVQCAWRCQSLAINSRFVKDKSDKTKRGFTQWIRRYVRGLKSCESNVSSTDTVGQVFLTDNIIKVVATCTPLLPTYTPPSHQNPASEFPPR